jgi:hypothetical protein
MAQNRSRLSGQSWGGFLLCGLFFALFFFILWLKIDLRLVYSAGAISNFPVFYKGSAFFRQSLVLPGGLVSYVSAFLSQFFFFSWAGALVVTMQAWSSCVCSGYVLSRTKTPGARWLRFVPPALVLITYTRYDYHFPTTMAFLVSLATACLYVRALPASGTGAEVPTGHRKHWLGPPVYVLLSAITYGAAGGAYWLFAVLCVLYESLVRRHWRYGLLYVLLAPAVAYVEGVMVYGASALDAYTYLLPISWETNGWTARRGMIEAVDTLYLFLPIAISLLHGVRSVVNRMARRRRHTAAGAVRRPSRGVRLVRRVQAVPAICRVAGALLVLVAVGAASFGLHDAEQKTLLSIHYHACRRMWPEVLSAAEDHPTGDLTTVNAVDRALYHTNRLAHDMFSYPQQPEALLVTGQRRVMSYWHKFDTLIDLGLMNQAEKNLTECMEVYGEHPFILERLALVNLAKSRPGAARVYLGALSKTLFHSRWADDCLERLDTDPNLTTDPEIVRLRATRLDRDSTAAFFDQETMLRALLESNRQNRMAFEYLMAWYLLHRQLGGVLEWVERLGDFDYSTVPRLYQEALLIYAYGTGKPLRLPGFSLDPEGRQRIEAFSRIFNRYGRDKRRALPELAGDYGDSYFFYHIYGFSALRK